MNKFQKLNSQLLVVLTTCQNHPSQLQYVNYHAKAARKGEKKSHRAYKYKSTFESSSRDWGGGIDQTARAREAEDAQRGAQYNKEWLFQRVPQYCRREHRRPPPNIRKRAHVRHTWCIGADIEISAMLRAEVSAPRVSCGSSSYIPLGIVFRVRELNERCTVQPRGKKRTIAPPRRAAAPPRGAMIISDKYVGHRAGWRHSPVNIFCGVSIMGR